ncbi:MAG TPA: phosphoglycolate phosphatase [Rhodocyclaceae bacterium]|nr:phosphoglycolate phosphatase [Rhodocyclaceae bacterium]
MLAAVLFDLDGTLADTAPDLGGALNRLLVEEGRAPLSLAQLRPHVSGGARGLIRIGFELAPGDAEYPGLVERFLDHYRGALCEGTVLFPGVTALLDGIEARGIKWGVVTNKAERFTLPLIEQLGLLQRAGCIVSGDSTPHPKPDPSPLLLACASLRVAPEQTIYVGDDRRDIVAGRAAGMRTVTAAYGYLGGDEPYQSWQADEVVNEPLDIIGLLERAC